MQKAVSRVWRVRRAVKQWFSAKSGIPTWKHQPQLPASGDLLELPVLRAHPRYTASETVWLIAATWFNFMRASCDSSAY